jgi:hypothetical protein
MRKMRRTILVLAFFALLPASCGEGSEEVQGGLPSVPDGYGFVRVPGAQSPDEQCYAGAKPPDPSAAVAGIAAWYETELQARGRKLYAESADVSAVLNPFGRPCGWAGEPEPMTVAGWQTHWTGNAEGSGEVFFAVWVARSDGRVHISLWQANPTPLW